jgi:hypothetical protein
VSDYELSLESRPPHHWELRESYKKGPVLANVYQEQDHIRVYIPGNLDPVATFGLDGWEEVMLAWWSDWARMNPLPDR